MDIKPIREKWPGTMTDRERFINQLTGKSFDRSFNMEFRYWEENYKTWNIFLDNGITCDYEADIFFGFDKMDGIFPNQWMIPGFEEKVIEETATSKIILNWEGIICEVPKDGHDTIPRYIKSSIETPDDWKRLKEEKFRRDDPNRIIDVAAWAKYHLADEGRDYPLGIWCGSLIGKIRDLLTFEGLCYAVYDYPDMVEDMVETCCVLIEDSLDQLLPHFRFDYANSWEDICFKNGPIVPVDFFKEVIMPRIKRISTKLKANGVGIWFCDCDGDVRPILPYMLEGGINCLFPYEVNSCTHPGNLLDEYGGELKIMGGVDKMKLIEGQDAIKAYMLTLEKYVERGGYIPFCDHLCPPDVKPENYLYYLDLKKSLFGLKDSQNGGLR